ncbi:MAG: SIMPL domain-containing protein [Rubrivivax sp.]|nr:SIMPL domain-containing protein [Rubrivivax sp.]
MPSSPRSFRQFLALSTFGAALAAPMATAWAQVMPQPQNVVSLTASASVEVNKDWLTVVFSTTREGADAAVVQNQLKQALDAALNEARKSARPGQLEVQTGGFSLYPRYAPPNPKGASAGLPGGIVGWQGSTELIVQGRDTQAVSQLTSRIQTLSIARVGFSLSREAREKVEADVSAEAIDRFRQRADAVSRQFGFAGYTVREVSVSADGGGHVPQPMMRAQAMKSSSDEALPVEAGKATVTATVNGSVQMK